MTSEAAPATEPSSRPVDKSGPRVRRMFASIAQRYDLLNHLLSLNIDRSWRRFTARRLDPQPGMLVLDCCTGTADLALAFDKQAKGSSTIIGTDFCRPMLEIGFKKVREAHAAHRIALFEADTLRLPFPDETFGIVTVAFGLRNVSEPARGLDEMVRVARPGALVAILEFSRPKHPVLGPIYGAFFRTVLPKVGQSIAPNKDGAYDYLPSSVMQFPEGQAMLDLMTERGLSSVEQQTLTHGIATLYIGQKPLR